MTSVDLLLLFLLTISAPFVTFIAYVLVRAAWRRPRINFLSATALMTFPIAAVVDVAVLSGLNTLAGAPITVDAFRTLFRLVLAALVVAVFYWYWLYKSGRFHEEEKRYREKEHE